MNLNLLIIEKVPGGNHITVNTLQRPIDHKIQIYTINININKDALAATL